MLSPYLSGSWSWMEYQCHKDHALVVCDHVDDGIRLSGFVLAGFVGSENVDLPYFGGPWIHGWIISVIVKRLVTRYIISSEYNTLLGPSQCDFHSFLDFDDQCFRVELIMAAV